MIAKIVYPENSSKGPRVSTAIECDRVHCEEHPDEVSVFISRKQEVVAEYSFKPGDGMDIYLIENGKTVDRLPRR